MARYLVTGGTGFIGSALIPHLLRGNHEAVVLTRHPELHAGRYGDRVSFVRDLDAIDNDALFNGVINLAGEGIGDKRWTPARKQVLLESRIGVTDKLVALLGRLDTKPLVVISGSAVGWYGAHDKTPLDEKGDYYDEFTHELCRRWELAARPIRDMGIRLCLARIGVVLGPGGMLDRLVTPFRFCLGGRLGSGRQMLSWIHRDDLVLALELLLTDRSMEGVYNLTAPGAVSNADFTRALGLALKRPTPFPMPAFMIRLLFGEMGERLLLEGQNVAPIRLLMAGFSFRYPEIDSALGSIFDENPAKEA